MKVILLSAMVLAMVLALVGAGRVARAERWDSQRVINLPGGGRANVQVWAK